MPPFQLDPERMRRYDRLQKVYRGDHVGIFDIDNDPQFPPVIVNVAASIIDALSGIIASKVPTFQLTGRNAEKRVAEIIERSSFGCELLEFVREGLLFGDAVFKVYSDSDGQTNIRCVSPKLWTPTPDPDDADTIIANTLASYRKIHNQTYMLAETHSPGLIEYHAYKVDAGKISVEIDLEAAGAAVPEWASLEPVIETGVDESLVIPWSYNKLCGDVYGTSELMRIWSLIGALDQRATQENRVLSKHADPRLIVADSVVQRNANGDIVIPSLDVILVPEGSSKDQMGYITWDGQLGSVDTQISRLLEQQLHVTQVSRLLLNADNSQAQTGLAVLAQLLPSIMKAEQIQRSLEKTLRTTIRVAQKLSATQKPFAVSPVKMSWGVQLPTDLQAIVQGLIMAMQGNLITQAEARATLESESKVKLGPDAPSSSEPAE